MLLLAVGSAVLTVEVLYVPRIILQIDRLEPSTGRDVASTDSRGLGGKLPAPIELRL